MKACFWRGSQPVVITSLQWLVIIFTRQDCRILVFFIAALIQDIFLHQRIYTTAFSQEFLESCLCLFITESLFTMQSMCAPAYLGWDDSQDSVLLFHVSATCDRLVIMLCHPWRLFISFLKQSPLGEDILSHNKNFAL